RCASSACSRASCEVEQKDRRIHTATANGGRYIVLTLNRPKNVVAAGQKFKAMHVAIWVTWDFETNASGHVISILARRPLLTNSLKNHVEQHQWTPIHGSENGGQHWQQIVPPYTHRQIPSSQLHAHLLLLTV
ncbi:hypothetical protein Vafri_10606, partial [Volvox africanus]